MKYFVFVQALALLCNTCYAQECTSGTCGQSRSLGTAISRQQVNRIAFSRSKGISGGNIKENTAVVNGKLHSGIYKSKEELIAKIHADIARDKANGYNSKLSNVKIGQPLACKRKK